MPHVADARNAFLWACELDVSVPKPGNVSAGSPAHDTDAAMFVASARAAAGPLFESGTRVGVRIERAIDATSALVARNTNLGIVLLCAPLAKAMEGLPGRASLDEFRSATRVTLDALTVDDARAAYRGIARANPGGLGRVSQHDVATMPTIDLRAAMSLAMDRDRVARQYAVAFADVFDVALPIFVRACNASSADADPGYAVQATFIALLAQWPDSHIVRRHGERVAQSVTDDAKGWRSLALEGTLRDYAEQLAAWDASLKRQRINPGTTADLVVTTAFAAACLDPSLLARSDSKSVQGTV